MPSTLGRLGLTGKTVPPNGLPIRFHRSARRRYRPLARADHGDRSAVRKIASSGGRGSDLPSDSLPETSSSDGSFRVS